MSDTTTAAVPFTWDALDQFKGTPFPADYPANVKRFYSPQDHVHEALKYLIAGATQSILCSIYGFDDPEFTAILLSKSQDPNVFVQINLDKTQAAGQAEVPLVAQLRACPSTRVAVGTSASGGCVPTVGVRD